MLQNLKNKKNTKTEILQKKITALGIQIVNLSTYWMTISGLGSQICMEKFWPPNTSR